MTSVVPVDSPRALRALPPEALPGLCAALREEIIRVCGRVGGHLGASLGAVELVVALHRVFRSPHDALVFDVGHQTYAHKLLTGRRARMDTLRQDGGLAPFCAPDESAHDAFIEGHASAAVSRALGLLTGRRLAGHDGDVVAILGDGGLTGGMAFEALNNAATSGLPFKLVLNDNGMSISANVGAVHALLQHDARRFFESLGLGYLGPVDGHDLGALDAALRDLRRCQAPAVLHTRTEKGRGFAPAEADRGTRGHAMGPFELRAGKAVRSRKGQATWSDAFAQALEIRMESDRRIVCVTPAMVEGSSLVGLKARFPGRVFDVGIAEQHAVAFAAGLSRAGLRPVVCLYSTFLQRAMDAVVHDVCLSRLPVLLAIDRAGLVGADGATHQGLFDVPWLRAIPELVVSAPSDTASLAHQLDLALAHPGPWALRFPRGLAPPPRPGDAAAGVGQARLLQQSPGAALTVAALGPLAQTALDAAQGQPWNVVDLAYAAPLDVEGVARACGPQGRLLVVEEALPEGGVAQALASALAGRVGAVGRLGLPAAFVPHGDAQAQRVRLGLSVDGIQNAARTLLKGPPPR